MVIISLSRRASLIAALILSSAAGAQAGPQDGPVPVTVEARPNPVARIELSVPRVKLLAGDAVALQVTAFDVADQPLANPRLTFRVTPAAVAKVARGVLTARKAGTAQVVALSGKISSDPVTIIVNEVGRIDISPTGPLAVNAGDTLVFHAQAYDVSGIALPNADYPNVPLTWKSSGGRSAPITQAGGLFTTRNGATVVTAVAGKVKSASVRVAIGRRNLARSTHIFLTGEPDSGLRSMFITIERVEVATQDGVWRTLVTRPEIDALVGQPIDVMALVNRRIQIGTGYEPEGDYRRMRIVLSTDTNANYVVLNSNSNVNVPVPFENPEDAVLDAPFYLYVTTGYPLNMVLDFRTASSLTTKQIDGSPTTYLTPDWDAVVMDDEELSHPFGALVGQLQGATNGDVFATNVDDGGTIVNYFGILDPNTGAFRISQLPAGRYELHVAVPGHAEMTISNLLITPGQDNVLPQPIQVQ
jgi:hypothetical protein